MRYLLYNSPLKAISEVATTQVWITVFSCLVKGCFNIPDFSRNLVQVLTKKNPKSLAETFIDGIYIVWGVSLAQVVYCVGFCQDTWKGLSKLVFRDIWVFLKLSAASAITLCLEIWYFMSIIVLTGHLEDPVMAVGSLSICMNLNGWESMTFIGINAAISVCILNELGSEHPRAAKYSVVVTILESLLIGLLCMVLIIVTRSDFAVICTNSKEMQKAVSDLAYLLSITMVLNSIQPVISSINDLAHHKATQQSTLL